MVNKYSKHIFLVFMLGFISSTCFGAMVPRLTGRVVDDAGLLNGGETRSLSNSIKSIEADSGGQVAVLIIKSLDGESLEDYSIKVAEKWRIGYKGKDNGLILLIVKNDKKIRIEVGYGWEGKINDARAGDIIRSMEPFFRNGEFDKGIQTALSGINYYLTGKGIKPKHTKPDSGDSPVSVIIILILFGIFFLSRFLGGGRTYTGGGGSGWFSGGGSSGGGFSGGGGSFGGGGASGGW